MTDDLMGFLDQHLPMVLQSDYRGKRPVVEPLRKNMVTPAKPIGALLSGTVRFSKDPWYSLQSTLSNLTSSTRNTFRKVHFTVRDQSGFYHSFWVLLRHTFSKGRLSDPESKLGPYFEESRQPEEEGFVYLSLAFDPATGSYCHADR
jgi:hypothetical protein